MSATAKIAFASGSAKLIPTLIERVEREHDWCAVARRQTVLYDTLRAKAT
ncbi:MAG: hypothetical protein M1541_05870 [Acidobacteria bacterium]|nr:hypothetical protein [Acidobacteriota bacterium]